MLIIGRWCAAVLLLALALARGPAAADAAEALEITRTHTGWDVTLHETMPASELARRIAEAAGASVSGDAGAEPVQPNRVSGATLSRLIAGFLPHTAFSVRGREGEPQALIFLGRSKPTGVTVTPVAAPPPPKPPNAAGVVIPLGERSRMLKQLPMLRKQ